MKDKIAQMLGEYGEVLPYQPKSRFLGFKPIDEVTLDLFDQRFKAGELEGIVDVEVGTRSLRLLQYGANTPDNSSKY